MQTPALTIVRCYSGACGTLLAGNVESFLSATRGGDLLMRWGCGARTAAPGILLCTPQFPLLAVEEFEFLRV